MMIENAKKQQFTYDKGITNVPSDAICSDNALSECVGMVYDNGEHRVIQRPEPFITGMSAYRMLYIHKLNDEERYIACKAADGALVWGYKDVTTFNEVSTLTNADGNAFTFSREMKIASIGKTLIFSDNNGMRYFLWTRDDSNNPAYEYLGDAFPRPEVEFTLNGRNEKAYDGKSEFGDEIYFQNNGYYLNPSKQDNWDNTVIGLYTGLRKKAWNDKRFVGSFCVRVALELYDGSYYHISNPIFMLNHFSALCLGHIADKELSMFVYGQRLSYRWSQDYGKWSDIIKNVVLFVTKEANLFDTTSDATLEFAGSQHNNQSPAYFMSGNAIYYDPNLVNSNNYTYIVLNSIPDSDLESVIKDGVYYKLCEIGLSGDGQYHNAGDHFDTHTIENITTQPQLGEDDYFSHCPIKAGLLYAYNARLNLAGVQRGFFEGFDNFMPFDSDGSATYEAFVIIKTDGGNVVVYHAYNTKQKQGIYFYYPDPRAKSVLILKRGTPILNAKLTEHPTLNGAYYFAGVSKDMNEPSSASGTVPELSQEPLYETLPNYILTSEVNNPFVFKAEGYYRVGTGKILAMSTVTQALSEGQFGQFPLLAFTDSGIWALSVASTGYFTAAHPMSREVCNNPASVTQTDGAVFFTSAKGLMVVTGSQVRCVSEQLSGKTDDFSFENFTPRRLGNFNDFLAYCNIAYDYRDSLLWLFNVVKEYGYVYAIKSGTFSKFVLDNKFSTVVNNYPDTLIQDTAGNVLSLTGRPDINDDTSVYDAQMLTRPMKLENAFALKRLHDMVHVHDMKGSLAIRIYVSNDLIHWGEIHSLLGEPFKYFRIQYDFTGLAATDRFAGTVIVTEEVRTNKLR